MATHAHSLSPNAHAPWAEIVPGADLMTVAEYERLPDDGWQYELVGGVLVWMPLSGGQASNIATRLSARLGVFVEDNALGQLTGADGGYNFSALGQPDTELGPDVAFVRSDKVPERGTPAHTRAWAVAPDLAVEVASPSQWRPEMAAKVGRYLAAGVRLVWVVWPRWEQVDVWHPGDLAPSATLAAGDALDGEDVVPGFSYPVARLFSQTVVGESGVCDCGYMAEHVAHRGTDGWGGAVSTASLDRGSPCPPPRSATLGTAVYRGSQGIMEGIHPS